jgi:hypothetical protein
MDDWNKRAAGSQGDLTNDLASFQVCYGARIDSTLTKTWHSFVSIMKFCEENFGVPSINQRDGSAENMSDCFDFTQTPLGAPK